MYNRFFLLGTLLLLLLLAGVFLSVAHSVPMSSMSYTPEFRVITVGGVLVHAEVVSQPQAREKGLSGRTKLGASEGMLFEFEKDDTWGFWMKDMLLAIDIVWISAEGEIITIAHSVTPDTYPTVFYPTAPARYVLEVPAGFAAAHLLAEGDKIVVK